MERLDSMLADELELTESSAIAALFNTSQQEPVNITNLTLFPYHQHSPYVAACYILAYIFIFVFCMVGNIVVCVTVMENRRMRTVTNLFIFNLAISDLLVGIFCIPTTLVDNLITGWPFSKAVCKMSGFVQGVSVSASVFTLVTIAVERFHCIVFPLQPRLSIIAAKIAIGLIWALAMVITCPAAVVLTVDKLPFHYMVYNDDPNHMLPMYTCYENFAKPQMRKIYTAVLFAHIYLVPLMIITVMYGSIGLKLCLSVIANRETQATDTAVQGRGRRGGQLMISKKKIRVIKMLIVVNLLFMVSWLPLWTLMMMTDYTGLDRDQLDLLATYIFPFAHWLAFSNSSANPIIYGYYNENFKRGFHAVWKSRTVSCLAQCQLWGRIARWARKERSAQAHAMDTEFRDTTCHHNHLVVGLRNKVHNDDNLSFNAELNRRARVGCQVVNSDKCASAQELEMANVNMKRNTGAETGRASSLGPSPYQAWDI